MKNAGILQPDIKKIVCLIMNRSLILALFGIFFSASGVAQDYYLKQISDDFDKFKSRNLQEKVFVHTDRSFYLAGETLWFKLYLTEGGGHKPLGLSRITYVEILDKENVPVARAKTAMDKGNGKGSFYLPLSLKSGNYTMRAYTHRMKNSSPDYFFSKELTILNSFLSPGFESPGKPELAEVAFFPEGGELVDGIRSKVAFKISDKSGKGADAKGVIVKTGGDTVAYFQSAEFGTGHFYLNPEAGESYKALVNYGTDSALSFNLPDAAAQGFVLQLERQNERELDISVQTSLHDQYIYLLVHTRQEVKVAEAIKTSGGKAEFKISTDKLGEGISHITLFNQEMKPVAERLFFKYPEHTLNLNILTDKPKYTSREKVSVKLNPEFAANPQAGVNLSLAVYQTDSLQKPQNDHILSYLLLTSDLKGKVESPSFYFENRSKKTEEAMDNLMLTHGWRRFRWQDVFEGKEQPDKYLTEYEGHIVQAIIEDKGTGVPVAGVASYLSVLGKPVQFYASMSNEKGEVRFVTEQLFGQKSIFLQNLPARKDLRIKLLNPFSEAIPEQKVSPLLFPAGGPEKLRRRHMYMQAQNIYWQNERNRLLAPGLDSTAFFGKPDQTYLLDNFTRFPTMEEVMREFVYEVRVRKQKGEFIFKIFDPVRDMFFTDAPLVLLDGFPVSDIGNIMSYNPLKTEKLEVVTDRFIIGKEIVFDGILSYTTYKGEMEGFPIDPEVIKLDYEGLQLQREFYSPAYEAGHQNSSRRPDFRTLLHWAPEIVTNEKGEAELSFYTSDLKGKYIIEVQGLSQEGNAAAETISFDVTEENL